MICINFIWFFTSTLFRIEEKLRLFIAIFSSPSHKEERRVIRKTWGEKIKKLPGVKVVYIFGKSSDSSSQVIVWKMYIVFKLKQILLLHNMFCNLINKGTSIFFIIEFDSRRTHGSQWCFATWFCRQFCEPNTKNHVSIKVDSTQRLQLCKIYFQGKVFCWFVFDPHPELGWPSHFFYYHYFLTHRLMTIRLLIQKDCGQL